MRKKSRCGKGFDIVHAINKIVPENIEFHTIDQDLDGNIKKSSFTGPNTNLKKRLKGYVKNTGEYDTIITPPINKLDTGAMKHDLAYSKYKDLTNRHIADNKLIKIAEEVLNDNNSTTIQKFNAGLVKTILKGKIKLGVGLGGNLGSNIDINELIKQAQNTSKTSQFQGKSDIADIIAPLVFLAGSIGIPALIKLIHDKLKKDGKAI
jgi:hypothetical protein